MAKRYRPWRAELALGILLACCPCAFALDPSLDVSQYAHTAWKVRDGFTKGNIRAIAQTPDGYLWLGTEFGLLRFDGVRAVPWQSPPNQHLPSSDIRGLLAAGDGTLWIGTSKGLASWKDGKLTQYAELAGQDVFRLLEDHGGSVWAGSYGVPSGRLCVIQSGSVHCYGKDGSLGIGVMGLYEDGKRNLWVGVLNGLWRWKPGPSNFYPMPGTVDSIRAFLDDNDGSLLFSTSSGIRRLVDGKTEAYQFPGTVQQLRAENLFRDHDGSLWIGTFDQGLVHVHQGRTDVFTQSDGLSGNFIDTLFEDREGNIWAANLDGLDRFRESAVATLSVKQGLSNTYASSVLAAGDGSVWLSTSVGLNRWDNGRVAIYGKSDGKLNGYSPNSLLQDDRGRIWVSTLGGVGYLENARYVSVSGVPGESVVRSIAEDTTGNLWLASAIHGLIQVRGDSLVQQIPWARLGRKGFANALAADPLEGGLWIGFFQGGVAYFKGGQVRASYAGSDGLGEGNVYDLKVAPDGTLWAATDGGLSRLKNGRISTLTSRSGLPCDTVYWLMEDDAHSFWLYTACGLVRIARPEMDAWAVAVDNDRNSDRTIQPTVFDSSDGVRSRSEPGGYSPLVTKSSDGRIWFLPGDGVSVIDPRHLPFNKLPPPVHVEQVTVDRKTYWQNSFGDPSSSPPRLPPLVRDLEIDYTALSFVAPEKNRFRVKLEGWDRDWQDVGNRRQAFYNNLSPGNYRFRVVASNNSGVWNEAGTFLDFSIAPAYYQTTWFRFSCVMAFMAMLWGLYRLRLRQMAQQFNVRMEERLGERTRIARDLHDTLLQSFHGLLLRFQTAHDLLLTRPAEARKTLESAIDQAAQAITEGRDAVQGLRSSTVETNDLAEAVRTLGEELATDETEQNPAFCHVAVEGTPRNLHPILRDEVYRIAGEAMRNAFSHAQARRIEVEIRYDERQFRLRVRDDGKGIDPKVLSGDGRAGHFGLPGMRERAGLVGGKVTVWSERDSGTEVELTIPASKAYTTPSAARRFWLTDKLSGKFSGKGTAMKS
jgi:ligand-binding sensor domain-containing protein/signal transduction histidine kinase